MDGTAAIEANRIALKRIVAMLADMAGLGEEAPAADKLAHVSDSLLTASLRSPPLPLKGGEERRPSSPPPLPLPFEPNEEEGVASPPPLPLPRRSGERWPAKRVGVGGDLTRDAPHPESRTAGDSPHPEARAEGAPRRTLPRILWRAILLLLRPAESAARRLIIAASRGLTVPPPHLRNVEPRPKTMEPLLRHFGIAVTMAPGGPTPASGQAQRGLSAVAQRAKVDGGGVADAIAPRPPTFPLFDPPRRLALYGQRRHTVPPHAAPRICVPGITEPAHLPPPPSPDDLVSAEHLTRRVAALAAALDDLPGQARRFARWKASRDADHARDQTSPRRLSPIRRGRPPGGRLSRYDPSITHPPNIREVDEILAHAHSLALYALESPDTS